MDPKVKIERAIDTQVQKAFALVDYHASRRYRAARRSSRWNEWWYHVSKYVDKVQAKIDAWFRTKTDKVNTVYFDMCDQHNSTCTWADELRLKHGTN